MPERARARSFPGDRPGGLCGVQPWGANARPAVPVGPPPLIFVRCGVQPGLSRYSIPLLKAGLFGVKTIFAPSQPGQLRHGRVRVSGDPLRRRPAAEVIGHFEGMSPARMARSTSQALAHEQEWHRSVIRKRWRSQRRQCAQGISAEPRDSRGR